MSLPAYLSHCLVSALFAGSLAGAGHETGDVGSPPASGPERRKIAANELVFDALVGGPEGGEWVVLLHGFPETSHCFRHQIPALTAAGYRVLAPDQRGYSPGARPGEIEDYALPNMVDDVMAMTRELGIERFHLVGHDWGSAVAWFTAMSHPESVKTLTALSVPHPFAFSRAMASASGDQAGRSGYMTMFRAEGAAERLLADDAATLRGIYSGPAFDEKDRQVYLDALGTPEALGAALNWYRAMVLPADWGTLTPIEMPALYLWSTADPTMSREGAELTEEFVEGPYRFVVLEGIGHWIPEEASERLNECLLEHLESSAPAARSGD